ncbi:MAG: HAD-IIIA family hydrolase [Bacteroidales bacterium]|nr:HAD-IIIA family hydrolase [Bacteroidales bacterium]
MKPDWKHSIQEGWTLFLDRDGVINRRIIDGYVTSWEEFEFLPGVLDAMELLAGKFRYIMVITNQQGVGKGLMTMEQVDAIHDRMCLEIEAHGGRIDGILVCPQLASEPDNYRKPSPEMAYMAQEFYPKIDLEKCVMVGDGQTDIEFGRNAGTVTVFIGEENPDADDSFNTLYDFAKSLHS